MIRRAIALSLLISACNQPLPTTIEELDPFANKFSSKEATLMVFEFEGELVTSGGWNIQRTVEDQLLYTIGHLNHDNSVGRLDALELTDFRTMDVGDGRTHVKYHAVMPVAWGSKTNLPTTYTFRLPRYVDYDGLNEFAEKYKDTCVDFGAHDVDSGSMWYYYRPERSGCALAEVDVVKFDATATVSPENTTGKYPEYHKVWEDGRLDVVAIFGKYEDGATTGSDAGIAAYNRFLSSVRSTLGSGVVTTPATVPSNPGVSVPDVTFEATLSGDRKVKITALLVDNVRTAGAAFDSRYNALSLNADLIFYNGHAGLGSNVRALAQKGEFVAGKYQIFFMNGCDTYAYVDGYLAEKKASINADDPNGTKYLDMVTNAMPSFFSSMPGASMAIVKGLLAKDAPKTYEEIFTNIDDAEVVVVTGEEDNIYVPGHGQPTTWGGMNEAGSVVKGEWKHYVTVELKPGAYVFTMAGDAGVPGGDADLYLRKGAQPTSSTYDCRPYKSGSNEECVVTLASAAKIYVSVQGYATAASPFTLTGRQQGTGGGSAWAGFTQAGSVAQNVEHRWTSESLPAGSYRITLAHDTSAPGGDADLYVKKGTAPTTASYDCRPYLGGSNESCAVTLSAPGVVHVMVRGYAAQTSHFILTGAKD